LIKKISVTFKLKNLMKTVEFRPLATSGFNEYLNDVSSG
jgi:hypothetical protein